MRRHRPNITDLLTEGGWGSESEAICLYTGLSTDNGNFRFGTTTARSHPVLQSSWKRESNLRSSTVCKREHDSGDTKTLGVAYTRTGDLSNGKGALFWLGKEDFASASADSSAVDGLVNVLLRITGVKVALFLTEINGENKVSIRTKPPYSARDIASAFGGGGHLQAAGAKPGGSFIDAVNAVKAEAEKYINDRASAAE